MSRLCLGNLGNVQLSFEKIEIVVSLREALSRQGIGKLFQEINRRSLFGNSE